MVFLFLELSLFYIKLSNGSGITRILKKENRKVEYFPSSENSEFKPVKFSTKHAEVCHLISGGWEVQIIWKLPKNMWCVRRSIL